MTCLWCMWILHRFMMLTFQLISGNDEKYKPNDVVGNTISRPSKVGPLLVALIITYLIIMNSFSPDVSISAKYFGSGNSCYKEFIFRYFYSLLNCWYCIPCLINLYLHRTMAKTWYCKACIKILTLMKHVSYLKKIPFICWWHLKGSKWRSVKTKAMILRHTLLNS